MSTYTEKHREYYVKNRERILATRLERERRWMETPKGKFSIHKRSARKRGIDFKLNFDEWWSIWTESGRWDERGTGANQYCMCRTSDVGPYEVGNVRIDTMASNSKENYQIMGTDELGRYQHKHTNL